jgi:hypothetical protein
MGTGVDSDRGAGSAAKAREPCAALIFRRASALALVGMAAFTDIVITRRRAGWPVRRVSVRSRITRQSPAYAPFVAFADVSVAPPAIASADTACRIRFITVLTPIGETRFWYRNFKFPELLREQMPRAAFKYVETHRRRRRGNVQSRLQAWAGRNCLKETECAVSFRSVENLGQGQESEGASGHPRY